MRPALLAIGSVFLPLLQACIVVPVTTHVYDEGCKIMSKQMELETVQIVAIQGCTNKDCVAVLAAASASVVASAVISGSIVVVGNVVYWFEKQGRCQRFD